MLFQKNINFIVFYNMRVRNDERVDVFHMAQCTLRWVSELNDLTFFFNINNIKYFPHMVPFFPVDPGIRWGTLGVYPKKTTQIDQNLDYDIDYVLFR